ncbi:hypothetical protein TcWFU_005603 [Taenia crassiceps]|uniref:MARVEL domain-containing protein n=1 Tax=Taenia crassiceps TaxID=6207 RepID=A0ABR4QR55_9CEST
MKRPSYWSNRGIAAEHSLLATRLSSIQVAFRLHSSMDQHQSLFAIFAFASTISFYGHIKICIANNCSSSAEVLTFSYPFSYDSNGLFRKAFGQGMEICQHTACEIGAPQGYAGLNISLVFGFSNVALWAASLWFLWKETPWFRSESVSMRQDSVLPEVDGAPL